MPIPKLRSDVWKYFSKVGQSVAECKLCGKHIKTSGNTSNLRGHMTTHHKQIDARKKENCEEPVAKKPLIETYFHRDDPQPTRSVSMVSSQPSTSETQQPDTPPGHQNQSDFDIETVCETTSTSSMSFIDSGKDLTPSKLGGRKDEKEPAVIQTKISQAFQAIANFEEGGRKYCKITEDLVYFICKDNLPFSIVEGKGFKKFIRQLSPLYKVPSRNTIKSRIINKYEAATCLFKERFQKIRSFTITSDIWTETMQMKSFLGITLHFLERDKLVSINLDVIELSESHTGEYICNTLQTILLNWNITLEQVVAVITDNDAKMLKAVAKLFGMSKHLSCFAHTLNLSVENAIKQSGIEEILIKVRNIVKFFKASNNASDDLRKEQLKQGIPEGRIKKLILDVATRWNSKFYMCERFLELLNILSNIMLNKPNSPPMLSAGEIELLKEIISLLRVMERLTVEASGENYVTISMVIPLINCAIKSFTTVGVRLPSAIALKDSLLKELEKRFGTREHVNLLAFGTFLDPRFKNIHFSNPIASSNVLKKINSLILNEINSKEERSNSSSPESTHDDNSNLHDKEIDIWSFHKSLTQQQNIKLKHLKNYDDTINAEIRMYLSAPLSDLKQNPLEVWEDLKATYPNLYQISRKYLGVVCTSVPSERLFSRAGDTVTQERNRLSGKLLPKLLFLNSLPDEFW